MRGCGASWTELSLSDFAQPLNCQARRGGGVESCIKVGGTKKERSFLCSQLDDRDLKKKVPIHF